jgi:CheY-like chemotaxis protein
MSRRWILLVEDSAATRKMLRVALELEGWVVVDVETGRAAIEAARATAPAVALLDCRLPDLEGAEVARQLHALHPNLPIVAVTGRTDADLPASQFVDVLLKPVEPSRIVALVEQWVGRAPTS